MRKLTKEEMKGVKGGVIIDCCVHISADGVNCAGMNCGHGPADGIQLAEEAASEGWTAVVICDRNTIYETGDGGGGGCF